MMIFIFHLVCQRDWLVAFFCPLNRRIDGFFPMVTALGAFLDKPSVKNG
jgi:hypothetical protein